METPNDKYRVAPSKRIWGAWLSLAEFMWFPESLVLV